MLSKLVSISVQKLCVEALFLYNVWKLCLMCGSFASCVGALYNVWKLLVGAISHEMRLASFCLLCVLFLYVVFGFIEGPAKHKVIRDCKSIRHGNFKAHLLQPLKPTIPERIES